MTATRPTGVRAAIAIALTLALTAGAAWLWADSASDSPAPPHADVAGGPPPGSCSWAQLLSGPGPRLSACRTPYGPESPFNQPIDSSPPLAPGSEATIAQLTEGDPPASMVIGDPLRDGGVPVYLSRPQDPLYTLHCTMPWGRCEIEGEQVRIPSAALPAGSWPDPDDQSDGHLTVVDPDSGEEYDLWNVSSKPQAGGRLDFAWGGKTEIDGDGLGSAAVAAGWGSLSGLIRVQEQISGRIPHALAIAVPCTAGVVYPASGGGQSCADAGLPGVGAPPVGAHLQLDMSEGEIEALDLPRGEAGILLAMARYGGFVSDTTGSDHWGFEYESAAAYSGFGELDPRIELARRAGVEPEDFNANGSEEYWLPFSTSVDWQQNLRVIDPCVSRGTCG